MMLTIDSAVVNPFTIADLYKDKDGARWLTNPCAVAVYLCRSCLKSTADYNQLTEGEN